MALATIAALLWGLRVRSADVAGFRSNHGLVATPFLASWIVLLMVLTTTTLLTGFAARHQQTTAAQRPGSALS